MTTSVNQTLTAVETNFLNLVIVPFIQNGLPLIPYIGVAFKIPVIGTILTWGVTQAATWVYGKLTLFIDVTTIRLSNAAHQSAYEAQSENLVLIAQANGTGSPQYAQAQTTALAALSQFSRFNT